MKQHPTYPEIAKRLEKRMKELGYESVHHFVQRSNGIVSYELVRPFFKYGLIRTSMSLVAVMKALEYTVPEIREALIEYGDTLLSDLLVGHTERLHPWERALLAITRKLRETSPLFLTQLADFLRIFCEVLKFDFAEEIRTITRATRSAEPPYLEAIK